MDEKRKKLMIIVLTLMTISIGGIGIYYWYNNTNYISTEDAKVSGDIIKVSPQISGRLLEFNVEEGDFVDKDQILGRQEMTNLPDSNIDMSLVRAPISGIVIKEQGNIGEIVSPGQSLAMIIDPSNLYISANIEETDLGKLRKGQIVDIKIDQFKNKKFKGKIKSIGQASNSAFSLLPTSTGGNFTKVVQRVPVKIELNSEEYKLLPGTNALVKIHLK